MGSNLTIQRKLGVRIRGTFFSLPASIFYCIAASALHQGLGSPYGLTAFTALFAAAFLPSSIALWVLADARQRSVFYDFGSFIFFTWPVLVPIYLFSTRGWRGLIPLGWFVLLYLAAGVVGSFPFWLAAAR